MNLPRARGSNPTQRQAGVAADIPRQHEVAGAFYATFLLWDTSTTLGVLGGCNGVEKACLAVVATQ